MVTMTDLPENRLAYLAEVTVRHTPPIRVNHVRPCGMRNPLSIRLQVTVICKYLSGAQGVSVKHRPEETYKIVLSSRQDLVVHYHATVSKAEPVLPATAMISAAAGSYCMTHIGSQL